MNYYAIIVAGGSGNRMDNSIPKQFLLLEGRPVMMHAIEVFFNCPQKPEIIIVLGKEMQKYWLNLCDKHNFTVPHILANSGPQRFDSVKSGLAQIKDDGIVAIHDAARPLVSDDVVRNSFEVALTKGNSVVGFSPVDSVRNTFPDGKTQALDRAKLKLIQTPQTFQVNQLKKAYEIDYRAEFTDDAQVMEHYGFNINIIEGNRENIKITYPEDIAIASLMIKKKRP
ncbi:2-C-methyl-D-erythritol 4-phosphate cytidylyltransferase [Pedobacter sp. JCM 36344]|uniref:2-C-methyl-D-erythritol 4-phosphate cytidylyltransferase n=1 Tax=Pedobacter sp. JCM 36344 TaxID=3374280 RepID=UPI00397D14C5